MRVYLLAVVISAVSVTSTAMSQDQESIDISTTEAESVQDDVMDRQLQFMMEHVKAYVGTRTSDGARLEAVDKPLLRWSNPNLKIKDGLYVAWTDPDGRPAAVAQVYFAPWSENWCIEHQSLSVGPLLFKSKVDTPWTPKKTGIEWQPVTGKTAKPAASEPLRLAQMRGIARRFRADDTIADNSALRLLSTPVMRYSVPKKGVIDGAIFVMVNGTDPEITLQIEVRRDDKTDQQAFHWAMSPMTTYELTGHLDDVEVWHMPRQKDITSGAIFHAHPLVGSVPPPKKSS